MRFRDINQRAKALMRVIEETHEKSSIIEFDIVRTEVRLRMIQSQLDRDQQNSSQQDQSRQESEELPDYD